jgi:hypothetical protein
MIENFEIDESNLNVSKSSESLEKFTTIPVKFDSTLNLIKDKKSLIENLEIENIEQKDKNESIEKQIKAALSYITEDLKEKEDFIKIDEKKNIKDDFEYIIKAGKGDTFEEPFSSEYVYIDLKPKILVRITDKNAELSSNALFLCEFFSQSEHSQTSWYHNGVLIQSNEKKYRIQSDINRSILYILNIEQIDKGVYEFRIENQYGIASSMASLNIVSSKIKLNFI